MNKSMSFGILIVAIAAVGAASLITSADAALRSECEKKGEVIGSSCPGNSAFNSPTFDQTVKNSGSKDHEPPGQQPRERQ